MHPHRSCAPRAQRDLEAQRRDRRTRAAWRSRRRRAVPAALAGLLAAHTIDAGDLIPDPDRLWSPTPLTITAVHVAARQHGHRLNRAQAAVVAAELVRLSLAIAHRRAAMTDPGDRAVVAWGMSRDAEDAFLRAAGRRAGVAA